MSRTALITGAAHGIGAAAARAFKEDGWSVVGVDLEESDAVVDRFLRIDVSDPSALEAITSDLRKNEGNIHALVNNAAKQLCKPLADTTPEEWDSIFATNARSVYLTSRLIAPLMAKGSAIVNVCSVHAKATSREIGAYAASKGAVLALTRSLALELAPDIRVNAVLPGAIDTAMLRSSLTRGHMKGKNEEELLQQLEDKHPLKRIGKPKEVAEAILFLADEDRASFMTGQSLIVDGGALCHLSVE